MKEEGICLCRAWPVPPTSQTGPLMPRAESEPWGSGQAHDVVSGAAQGTQVGEAGVMAPYSPGQEWVGLGPQHPHRPAHPSERQSQTRPDAGSQRGLREGRGS